MANKTISMLQLRRIIQLIKQGYSIRTISRITGVSRKTVSEYLIRLEKTGSSYCELEKLSEEELALLTPKAAQIEVRSERYSDFIERLSYFRKELENPKTTRMILWEEYKSSYPEGYSYSQFCEHLSNLNKGSLAVMHFDYKPGEYLQFDFAGDNMYYFDKQTGEKTLCPVLVCVLPFSSYVYVEALHSQTREQVIGGLNSCLEYFGGVPRCIISDNMRSWVKKSNRYEPAFTIYAEQWSLHYGTTLDATRVRKPRDKASVESHVNVVYNRIYSALRNVRAYSLQGLNVLIREQLLLLNQRKMQNRDYSRFDYFTLYEKQTLGKLPETFFVPKYTFKATVQNNYHIFMKADKTYYSVPYKYIGRKVVVVFDDKHVEIYLNNDRIAFHQREYKPFRYTTNPSHMPKKHSEYYKQSYYTDVDYIEMAEEIGNNTRNVIEKVITNYLFVQQAYKSCEGIIRLSNKYGSERLEAACKRALQGSTVKYKIIQSILEKGLDQYDAQLSIEFNIPEHENLRGEDSYQ